MGVAVHDSNLHSEQASGLELRRHIEAINTAIRVLGWKATMVEIWAWARKPAELEVENGKP